MDVDICWHMLTISTHHKGIQRHGSIVDHHGSYDHNIIPGFVGVYRASTQHRQLLSCSIKAPLLLRAFPEEETSKEANENEPKKGCVWTVYSDHLWPEISAASLCGHFMSGNRFESTFSWLRNLFPASREVICGDNGQFQLVIQVVLNDWTLQLFERFWPSWQKFFTWGFPKMGGTPSEQWMVYFMENPTKMDDDW